MQNRRKTREVRIGKAFIGGNHPILVQTMITSKTEDVSACVEEIKILQEAGAELVRIATPTLSATRCIEQIKNKLIQQGIDIPLSADVHHQGSDIAIAVSQFVDKVRINPGLFVFKKPSDRSEYYSDSEIRMELESIGTAMAPVIEALKKNHTALRIGVNHGSLSERMFMTYGDTPEGMVESAKEYIGICEAMDFYDIVVSLKASRLPIMIAANKLMTESISPKGNAYPLHLGVTEAGDGDYARIKSSIGIGSLLVMGIGDTIRVSLSEPPMNEIPVCYDILQALGLRRTKVEYIACPSCGRTQFDLQTVLSEVKTATSHLKGMDIAVMGCIVNGPGEMADADYGYVGKGHGLIALYRKKELVKNNIPESDGVRELIALIKADGRWTDPE